MHKQACTHKSCLIINARAYFENDVVTQRGEMYRISKPTLKKRKYQFFFFLLAVYNNQKK